MSGESVQRLIEQLEDKASTRRRSAAKKLRRLKPRQAGPALLNALANEIKDKRTWETQYQMIMALGEIGYTESLDFLYQLTDRELDATMVHIATGDAITRLTYIKDGSVTNALNLIDSKRDSLQLIEGIFRAIAILKLVPQEEEIERIVGYGISASTTDNNQTWIASAAAGWNGVNVEHFLTRCATSDNPQVKKAAEYALNKRYPKWSIL